jgi:anti-sigma-K factor RskA
MTGKTEERHAQLELCIPFVFGRLNPGNRKQFEAHLATGCEQYKTELSALYEAIAMLPLTLRQEAPPSGVRQRLLSRISSKRPEQPRSESRGERSSQPQQREKVITPSLRPDRPERPWYLYVSIVMGALLIVALVIFVNQLVGTAGSQEKKIAELQGGLQQNQDVLAVLQAERLEVVTLTAVTPGSAEYGRIFWDPVKRNAVVQTSNLPVEPEGKQYQLWIFKEKKYLSAGVFDRTSGSVNTLKAMALPADEKQTVEGFAITLEPKGGSPEPTGAIQLRGATK